MLLTFTDENLTWLNLLIEEAKSRTEDTVKLATMADMQRKITALGFERLRISITKQQIQETNLVMQDLQEITDNYAKQVDITDLEMYDNIKKQITGKLQYLSTYKDIFMEEALYLEDVYKKEVRMRLSVDIRDAEGVSLTQADKLVDMDSRYTTIRDDVFYIKRIANTVKTKYAFYTQFWQMVFQSVSTASKEKYASKHNNDA